jgi:hypothetical protein
MVKVVFQGDCAVQRSADWNAHFVRLVLSQTRSRWTSCVDNDYGPDGGHLVVPELGRLSRGVPDSRGDAEPFQSCHYRLLVRLFKTNTGPAAVLDENNLAGTSF